MGGAAGRADIPEEAELAREFLELATISAEEGPELAEDVVAGVRDVGAVALDDAVDDVHAVFEVVQEAEEGLRFVDEARDFGLEDAGVGDVLVEEDGGGHGEGCEGGEEAGGEAREEAGGGGKGQPVEDAGRPSGGGEDGVDGAASVRYESLQVHGG